MSIIFYNNEEEKKKAYESKKKEEESGNLKLCTEVLPLIKFFPAENYHQKYYLQLVRELMKEFSSMYSNFNDFINSTSAAHVNGYIKGCGSIKMLMEEIEDLGLSEKSNNRLIEIVKGYGR
ncbi:Peptide methionine sulfoxide reductase [Maledivibacter halophilus]|uniref:peptide-methionine (S)-S-oxide reductase n=2 Tax=Maledivibacter halophilus TaxID=36842 RepID=A0A1T5M7E5_9FIRM|nr:Peptide methionine sulfoxide reductase [Maledivibacter halophilus]